MSKAKSQMIKAKTYAKAKNYRQKFETNIFWG